MTARRTRMTPTPDAVSGILEDRPRPGRTRLRVPWARFDSEDAVFAGISLGVFGLAGLITAYAGTIEGSYLGAAPGRPAGFFRPFLGSLPPAAVVAATAVAGAVALRVLRSRGWFRTYAPERGRRGYAVATGLAAVFAVEAIAADLLIARLPADGNVPMPWSVPFYPVMGYLVEVGLGVVPLAVILAIVGRMAGGPVPGRLAPRVIAWSAMVLVSIPEAVYQGATSLPGGPSAAAAYIGFKVFAFNLVQLSLFRRYDFVAMCVFRLVYYACWHVAWGQLRLQLLF